MQGIALDITSHRETEERLGQSEARYRNLVENSPDLIYVLDDLGRVQQVNRVGLNMFGYASEEDIVGQDFTRFVHEEDREMMVTSFLDAMQTHRKRTAGLVFRLLKKDGSVVWSELSSHMFFDDQGRYIEEVGVVRDITERRLGEERLRRSEERFRRIFANATLGMALLNGEGCVVQANRTFCRCLGYGEGEIHGVALADIAPEVDLEKERQGWEESAGDFSSSWKPETRFLRKSGQVLWGRMYISPIHDQGEPDEGTVVMVEDMLEKRRVQVLEEREERLRLLSGDDVFWILDRDGVVTYVTPSLECFTGMSPGDVVGRGLREILSPPSFQMCDRFLRDKWGGSPVSPGTPPLPMTMELAFLGSDGGVHWGETRCVVVRDAEGRPVKVLGVTRDINRRKLVQDELDFKSAVLAAQTNASPDGIMVVDDQGKVLLLNRRLLDIWEAPDRLGEELDYGQLLDHAVGVVKDPEGFLNRVVHLYKNKTEKSRAEHYLKDGRTLERYSSPLVDEGGRYFGRIWFFRDISERKAVEQSLEHSRERLHELTNRLARAEEMERQRLARDLHDGVGQMLAGLAINLNFLDGEISGHLSGEGRRRWKTSMRISEEITQRIRDVMSDLRPSILDDYGIVSALRWYGDRFSRDTGIQVKVEAEPVDSRLAMEIETTLFRIAQEALTNVAKHAGVREATVVLEEREDRVCMVIADRGVGLTPHHKGVAQGASGWGLATMEERAHSVGGRLRVESVPGQGTRVIAEVGRKPFQPRNPQT